MIRKQCIVVGVALLLLTTSCERKLTWQQSIKECYGKKIDFDGNKQFFFCDTILSDDVLMQVPIKIVSFIEDNLCDSCLVNYLKGASIFMEETRTDSVLFFAVLTSRSEEQIRNIICQIKSKKCIIIKDLDNVLLKKNTLNKYTRFFRVLLLDAHNQVILSGDPLLNYKLEKLYINTINNLNSRDGDLYGKKK